MGTMLVWIVVVCVIGTTLLAFASYRRHSRAAKARSMAALNILLAEAYELSENADATPDRPSPDDLDSDEPNPVGPTIDAPHEQPGD